MIVELFYFPPPTRPFWGGDFFPRQGLYLDVETILTMSELVYEEHPYIWGTGHVESFFKDTRYVQADEVQTLIGGRSAASFSLRLMLQTEPAVFNISGSYHETLKPNTVKQLAQALGMSDVPSPGTPEMDAFVAQYNAEVLPERFTAVRTFKQHYDRLFAQWSEYVRARPPLLNTLLEQLVK